MPPGDLGHSTAVHGLVNIAKQRLLHFLWKVPTSQTKTPEGLRIVSRSSPSWFIQRRTLHKGGVARTIILEISSSATFFVPPRTAAIAFYPMIGPISNEFMPVISSQEPHPLSSLLSFSLTLPTLSIAYRILPSPHITLSSLFLNSKLFQTGTEPVWHKVDPKNKCCHIKKERKEEKEEKTASLLDSVSLLTWGEFGTIHKQDMVAWTAEKVPLGASLLELAGSSESQWNLSPPAHVTVDFHMNDRWLGT